MVTFKDDIATLTIIIGVVAIFSITDYNFNLENGNFSISKKEKMTWDEENISKQIHEHINHIRLKRGLSELEYSKELDRIASFHSKQMSKNNFFSHTTPEGQKITDRYDRFGVSCFTSAENIYQTYWNENVEGVGFVDTRKKLADSVVEGWMNSPGHRKNILLKNIESEGIGIYKNSEDRVYITQNFCS